MHKNDFCYLHVSTISLKTFNIFQQRKIHEKIIKSKFSLEIAFSDSHEKYKNRQARGLLTNKPK